MKSPGDFAPIFTGNRSNWRTVRGRNSRNFIPVGLCVVPEFRAAELYLLPMLYAKVKTTCVYYYAQQCELMKLNDLSFIMMGIRTITLMLIQQPSVSRLEVLKQLVLS